MVKYAGLLVSRFAALAACAAMWAGLVGAPVHAAPPHTMAAAEDESVDGLVRVQDAVLHTRIVGPADADATVILVHGGPGLALDYLLPLAQLSGPQRRVVFYDQRGAGASPRPYTRDYGLSAQVADLDAVRAASGAESIHLIGHSWGTVVALAYAGAHPERVTTLTLIGMGAPTAAADRVSFGASFALRKAMLVKTGVVPRHRPKVAGDDCMAAFTAVLPVHFADARHPSAHNLAGSYHCDVGRATLQAAGEWDFRNDLEGLQIPVLLIIGAADANYSGYLETVRHVDPDRLVRVELEACGHFPWVECPQRFYSALDRFLSAGTRSKD